MKTYARIQDGAVAELLETDGDITRMFHPDLIWVEGGEGTQEGDLYDGERFTRPIIPEPEPIIPKSVTPAQGLMALYVLKGITEDDILAAINTIEDVSLRYQALIAFKKATAWERESESMGVVAQLLALTATDKDALFSLGATYTNL